MGDRVIVIGRLGYMGERHPGVTPVMALDLASYQIRELPSQGELPGWIFRHEAELGPEGITIRGGEIYEEIGGEDPDTPEFRRFPVRPGNRRLEAAH